MAQPPGPRTSRPRAVPALALLAGFLCPAATQEPGAAAGLLRTSTSLVARVNGHDITLGELSREVNQYVMANRLGPDSGLSIPAIQRTVLDRMIATELMLQRAREIGLVPAPAEIDARLDTLRGQAGSPEDFRLMLTVQNLTESLLRDRLAEHIVTEKLIDAEVFAAMAFSDAEVRAHYEAHQGEITREEQVHVRHIVVVLRPDMTEEERRAARDKIDALKGRLDGGEAFESLAVEQSEDAAAASGGDLGWIERSAVSGPFQVVAFSLAEGEVSDVVATDYGYHIIEVMERKGESAVPLAEARPMVEERLRDERLPGAVRDYLARLRQQAQVEMFMQVGD